MSVYSFIKHVVSTYHDSMFLVLCWPLVLHTVENKINQCLCLYEIIVWYNLTGFEKHNLRSLELRCLDIPICALEWIGVIVSLPVTLSPCLYVIPVPPPLCRMFLVPPALGIDRADNKVTFRPGKLVTCPRSPH